MCLDITSGAASIKPLTFASGMSMRLAFDLGLHIDMTPYVDHGEIGLQEAEVRKVAFWGSYVADQ